VTFFDSLLTPFGTLYLLIRGKSLTGISFTRPRMKTGPAPKVIRRELADYFQGNLREFTFGIHLREGTEFEKKVWRALREVPYGETRSYKWLAERVGQPGGSRAVGQALGKNPLPIVLPCHRIIESGGKLGGYSSGVDVKRRLLLLEHYHVHGESEN
jgi:O-6-methylguanine DNA methyltransferase